MEHYLIPRRPARIFVALIGTLALVNAAGFAAAVKMVSAVPLFCPFEALIGLPCPGCGMTRAMLSLITGHVGAAAAHNPFCFFIALVLAASVLPAHWLGKVPPVITSFVPYFYALVLAAIVAFWVFGRLLPVWGG